MVNMPTPDSARIPRFFQGQIQEHYRYGYPLAAAKPIDILDRKIIYLLYQNSRYAPSDLARFLRVSRETVQYRIRRLQDEGIIEGFVTLIDNRKVGMREYRIFFVLKTASKEKAFLEDVKGLPGVATINICAGSYDVHLALWVRDEEEFIAIFKDILDRHVSLIKSFDIAEGLDRRLMGMNFLLSDVEKKLLSSIKPYKGSSFSRELRKGPLSQRAVKVSVSDKKILEQVKLDSRKSIADISREVGLGPLTVKKKIAFLIRSGVIKQFFPITSFSKLGYQWWQVLVKCTNVKKETFLTFIEQHQNMPWYVQLLGKWDYMVSIYVRDNAELHKVLDELRNTFGENIMYHDLYLVFSQVKFVQRVNA